MQHRDVLEDFWLLKPEQFNYVCREEHTAPVGSDLIREISQQTYLFTVD